MVVSTEKHSCYHANSKVVSNQAGFFVLHNKKRIQFITLCIALIKSIPACLSKFICESIHKYFILPMYQFIIIQV